MVGQVGEAEGEGEGALAPRWSGTTADTNCTPLDADSVVKVQRMAQMDTKWEQRISHLEQSLGLLIAVLKTPS